MELNGLILSLLNCKRFKVLVQFLNKSRIKLQFFFVSRQPKEQNDLSLMFQGAKRTKLKIKMLSRKITRVFFFPK